MSSTSNRIFVNEGYICANFNIDEERQEIEYTDKIDTWVIEDYDGLTVKELKSQVNNYLNQFQDDDLFDIDYWGCEGSRDFIITRKKTRPETDEEVIGRLIRKEYARLKKEQNRQKRIEEARKLLKEVEEAEDDKTED